MPSRRTPSRRTPLIFLVGPETVPSPRRTTRCPLDLQIERYLARLWMLKFQSVSSCKQNRKFVIRMKAVVTARLAKGVDAGYSEAGYDARAAAVQLVRWYEARHVPMRSITEAIVYRVLVPLLAPAQVNFFLSMASCKIHLIFLPPFSRNAKSSSHCRVAADSTPRKRTSKTLCRNVPDREAGHDGEARHGRARNLPPHYPVR